LLGTGLASLAPFDLSSLAACLPLGTLPSGSIGSPRSKRVRRRSRA
jgi:hypothetical protein